MLLSFLGIEGRKPAEILLFLPPDMEHLQMFLLALWDVSKKTQGTPDCPSHWDWGMSGF